ncbi:P-loop containing nucleoside triphosphate hydrolase protein [Pyronema omphalodes]|nr:P-loop containing nucleoside triphosphate hydrolase protein [Pyronema omphalodes]
MARTSSLNPKDPKAETCLTVRPWPSSQAVSHKNLLRVYLPTGILVSLGIKSGETVQIAPKDPENPSQSKWWPSVAWRAESPEVRGAALVSEAFRGLLGIGFEHKVLVRRYQQDIREVDKITLKELLEEEDPRMKAGDRDGWRFFLEHILLEMKYIYEGVILSDIAYKGRKRTFRVEKIIPTEPVPGPEEGDTLPVIPIYKSSEISGVKLLTETIAEPPKKAAAKPAAAATTPTDAPKVPVPAKKVKATEKAPVTSLPSSGVTFDQIGGLNNEIKTLRMLVSSALEKAQNYADKGLVAPRGILLYGPPGTGKTMMMKAVAAAFPATKSYELGVKVMGKYQGESEAEIRRIFTEARKNQPSIIFMDEIDSLAPKRSQGGEGTETRVITTLLTEMDALQVPGEDGSIAKVVFVAATNNPNDIDLSLRRPGRFTKELEIGIPNADARREILQLRMKKIDINPMGEYKDKDEFISAIAAKTHGYVGADLEAVVTTAFTEGMERIAIAESLPKPAEEPKEPVQTTETTETTETPDAATELSSSLNALSISPPSSSTLFPPDALIPTDFSLALTLIKPTAMREIFLETPKVRWSDIGGQHATKQALREAVEWPLKHPAAFARLGAVATESGLNFMVVKGPELLSMYVGESERKVREIFRKARAASPSIIFFDEIDALTASREGSKGGGVNVLTALLNEMDGIEALKDVVILAATNRPELIDPALMRPGRLDTILYVGPPDLEAREQILNIKLKKMSVAEDVDIGELARRLDGCSGAEIVNVCDEAVHAAMRESFEIENVAMRHFEEVVKGVRRQITEEMKRVMKSGL